MYRNFIKTCLAICIATPLAAQARHAWGTAGTWTVLVDSETGGGCLMQKDFENGLRIEFGYVPTRRGGFFAALSENWTDIEPGTSGVVKFITDEAKFAGEVEMIEAEGRFGGWAFFNNPNLTTEMAARRSITVIGPKGGTFEVDLSGTSRAIRMLEECQSGRQ